MSEAEQIRVHVVDYGADRKSLFMRYIDPVTGKQVAKSAQTRSKKEAAKAAAKWEAELQEGRYKPKAKITWSEFREKYEDEHVAGKADNTGSKVASVFNVFEELINPAKLASVTTSVISDYQKKLRTGGRSETTIKSHLAHLKAALRWAHEQELLATVPKFSMPSRTKAGRHRPLALEEFERMLSSVSKVVNLKLGKNAKPLTAEQLTENQARADSWKHLMTGLWWSGLRIAESLNLSWDDDELPMVMVGPEFWFLRIPAKHQKNHKDELLPIAPEFQEFLARTPEAERHGFVFNPRPMRGTERMGLDRVKHVLSTIGEKANVKVGADDDGSPQFASAHDFRRSFADRWSKLIMPADLMQLMRHASYQTTMQFYIGKKAKTTAETLRKAVSGNLSGNLASSEGPKETSGPVDSEAVKMDVNLDAEQSFQRGENL